MQCDGQKPCATCISTEGTCVYSHDDARRLRHKQTKVDNLVTRPSIEQFHGGSLVETTQIHNDDKSMRTDYIAVARNSQETCGNEYHHTFNSKASSCKPESRGLVAHKTDLAQEAIGVPICDDQTNTRTLLSKKHDHSDIVGKAQLRTMKDMQGKFEKGTNELGTNLREGTSVISFLMASYN